MSSDEPRHATGPVDDKIGGKIAGLVEGRGDILARVGVWRAPGDGNA